MKNKQEDTKNKPKINLYDLINHHLFAMFKQDNKDNKDNKDSKDNQNNTDKQENNKNIATQINNNNNNNNKNDNNDNNNNNHNKNLNLVPCECCHQLISKEVQFCPHCGHESSLGSSHKSRLVLLLLWIFLQYLFTFLFMF